MGVLGFAAKEGNSDVGDGGAALEEEGAVAELNEQ